MYTACSLRKIESHCFGIKLSVLLKDFFPKAFLRGKKIEPDVSCPAWQGSQELPRHKVSGLLGMFAQNSWRLAI